MIRSIVFLVFLVNLCSGLYFHIGETERKCFIEEIPDETTVLGLFSILFIFSFQIFPELIHNFRTISVNYKVELFDPRSGGYMPSSPGIGMHVEVKDPDDKLVLSRVYSSEGESGKQFQG